jgi:hypothetical protein
MDDIIYGAVRLVPEHIAGDADPSLLKRSSLRETRELTFRLRRKQARVSVRFD